MSASLESLLARAAHLRRAGQTADAAAAYEQLLAQHPDLPDSWYNLALLQRRLGRPEAALASYGQALARGVSDPEEVHLNRAVILADDLRREADAERELAAALTLNPHYIPALLNLGNLHEDHGRRSGALASYERILALDPAHPDALARAAGVRIPSGPDDPMIPRLRAALDRPGTPPAGRAALGFALGRTLDGAGRYDEAFEAYAAANRASRDSAAPGAGRYDRAAMEARVDALIEATRAPWPAPPGPLPGPAPIFICGMFRSGSTLVEQVLAGHPRITAGGELDLIAGLAEREMPPAPGFNALPPPVFIDHAQRYLEAVGAAFPNADLLTDKRPDNLMHVWLIKRLFPQAKIINSVRDPLDNALSVFFLHLDHGMAYALDLMDIGHYQRQQRRLMSHWKSLYPNDIFEFNYDAFVADPRPPLERLLAFLGLDWDDRCLAFHQRDNAVKTASVWQVREPLYQRSSGRAGHYARQSAPLKAWLADQDR
ncbi:MAG: tetratricopeptide repeat-containing sulfotransferase family protein [Caulobacter sp.]